MYNIVRDKITTYAEFKQKFESRYWNSHTQRLLQNEIEYGRYDRKQGITPGNYIIQQVERAKHLTPAFSEVDIVTKLAYHFSHNIRVAAFTQGIRTVDELLILVSQSETVFDFGGGRYNPNYNQNNDEQNRREQCNTQTDQRPSTSSAPQQTPPNKPFEYKGKPNFGRQKPQNRGNDGTPTRTIQTVAISDTGTPAQTSEAEIVRDPVANVKHYHPTKKCATGHIQKGCAISPAEISGNKNVRCKNNIIYETCDFCNVICVNVNNDSHRI